jgi:hypothetical protein
VAALLLSAALVTAGLWGEASRSKANAPSKTNATRPASPPPATEPAGRFVPQLEFRLLAQSGDKSDADEMADPDGKKPMRVLKHVDLDERDVARARPSEGATDKPVVDVVFTDAGMNKFAAFTAANINHRLVIVFEGKMLMAATIHDVYFHANITPEGEFTGRQVQALVDSINRLPRPPAAQPAAAPKP